MEQDAENGLDWIESALACGNAPWAGCAAPSPAAPQPYQSAAAPVILEPSFVELDPHSKRFRGRRDKAANKVRRLKQRDRGLDALGIEESDRSSRREKAKGTI
jgi:hypothetical protein